MADKASAELSRQHAFESAVLRQELTTLRFELSMLRDETDRSKEDALHVRRNVEQDRDLARAEADKLRADAARVRDEAARSEQSLKRADAELQASREEKLLADAREAELRGEIDALRASIQAQAVERDKVVPAGAKPRRLERVEIKSGKAAEVLPRLGEDAFLSAMVGGTSGGGGLDALAHALRTRRMGGLSGSMMPPAVRNMIIDRFSVLRAFSALDHALRTQLVTGMHRVEHATGQVICTVGQEPRYLLIVESGKVGLTEGDENARIVEELPAGTLLCEDAITLDVPCTATAIALQKTVLWGLDAGDFRIARRWLRLEERSHVFKMMRLLPAFSDMTDRQLSKLADVAVSLRVAEGELIIREKDDGDALFMVDSGDAQVYIAATNHVIKHFSVGDYFGETSLLFNMKRTASVKALSPMVLIRLQRSDFLRLPPFILGAFKRNINLTEYEKAGIALPDEVKKAALGRDDKMASGVRHVGELPPNGMSLPRAHPDEVVITGPLARGAYGFVFLAKDRRTGAHWAVKLLTKFRLASSGTARHAASELLLMRTLSHPCIVGYVGAYHGAANVAFIVEPCFGGDLFRLIDLYDKGMKREDAAFYAGAVVLAIGHLHAHEWIYRDLKPENVLLDAQGFPRLCDFGFARQISDRAYTRCGTPEYMSRELVVGEGANEASDWWAVGILIYEMLTGGKTPFMAESIKGVYDRIIAGKVDYPERHFDERSRQIVSALLQPKLADRLGYLSGGVDDICAHPFFAELPFDSLVNRVMEPPWRPRFPVNPLNGKGSDVSAHFDNETTFAVPGVGKYSHVTLTQLCSRHLADERDAPVHKHISLNKGVPDGTTWAEYFRKHFGLEVSSSSFGEQLNARVSPSNSPTRGTSRRSSNASNIGGVGAGAGGVRTPLAAPLVQSKR